LLAEPADTQHGLVFHSLPPSSELHLLTCVAASVSKSHQTSLQENSYLTFINIGPDWFVPVWLGVVFLWLVILDLPIGF